MAAELEIGREVGAGTASATAFYRVVLQALTHANVPHLVGGAYALAHYTRAPYQTKDLDVFLRRGDLGPAFGALRACGYRTEDIYPHFLGKVHDDPHFVDLIFGSGNGIVWVDDGRVRLPRREPRHGGHPQGLAAQGADGASGPYVAMNRGF
jgi:hypothetical protein